MPITLGVSAKESQKPLSQDLPGSPPEEIKKIASTQLHEIETVLQGIRNASKGEIKPLFSLTEHNVTADYSGQGEYVAQFKAAKEISEKEFFSKTVEINPSSMKNLGKFLKTVQTEAEKRQNDFSDPDKKEGAKQYILGMITKGIGEIAKESIETEAPKNLPAKSHKTVAKR